MLRAKTGIRRNWRMPATHKKLSIKKRNFLHQKCLTSWHHCALCRAVMVTSEPNLHFLSATLRPVAAFLHTWTMPKPPEPSWASHTQLRLSEAAAISVKQEKARDNTWWLQHIEQGTTVVTVTERLRLWRLTSFTVPTQPWIASFKNTFYYYDKNKISGDINNNRNYAKLLQIFVIF